MQRHAEFRSFPMADQVAVNRRGLLHSLALLAACCTAIMLLAPSPARAALLAEESFPFNPLDPANPALASEYEASAAGPISASAPGRIIDGSGQNPTSPFFTGAWTGANTSLWQVQDVGLTHAGQPSSGGSVRFDWTSSNARQQSRLLASPPTVSPGDEFWMSGLLVKHATADANNSFGLAGFASTSANGTATGFAGLNDNNTQGWRIGFLSDGANVDLIYRSRDTSGASAANTVILDNAAIDVTHLVFIRGVVDGGTGTNDLIEIWVNPADFSTQVGLGAPDITLEDSSLADNTAFSRLVHEGFGFTNQGFSYDEFRLGTTFLDVAPNATVFIPEPSSFALLGLGLCGWMRRRRIR